MGALSYLVKKNVKNSLKELKRKPAKLILYILFFGFLIFLLSVGNTKTKTSYGSNAVEIYKGVSLFFILFYIYLGINSGLEKGNSFFRLSDVNFLFTSPISPQKILIYGFLKQLYTSIIMIIFFLFQIPNLYNFFPIKSYGAIIIFLNVFLITFATSILGVLIYSIGSKYESSKPIIKKAFKILIGIFALGLIYCIYINKDIKTGLLMYLSLKLFDYIPFIGWVLNLFMAAVNGVNTMFYVYLLLTIALIILIMYIIYAMELDYYEDAISATETKEETLAKVKAGKSNLNYANKKVRKVRSNFNAIGGKTIFQKQLLEYRKIGLLFVDKMTLMLVSSSLIFGFFAKDLKMIGALFFSVYMLLIFSIQGKWASELNKPYIYLIPCSSISKIFYATLTEHMKNLVDGFVLFVPCGILLKASMLTILLSIMAYVSFGAVFIYADLLIRRIFGGNLSKAIEMFLKIILLAVIVIPGIIIGFIIIGILNGQVSSYSQYGVMIVYNVFICFISILLSKGLFEKLEMK